MPGTLACDDSGSKIQKVMLPVLPVVSQSYIITSSLPCTVFKLNPCTYSYFVCMNSRQHKYGTVTVHLLT